ncbi:MAG: Tetratricopeptide 2 repeat protein [Myxococcaceae bacterium]|nr:Tetratricopeptide 2 repeat protein [Myxococcaceae bacterium]
MQTPSKLLVVAALFVAACSSDEESGTHGPTFGDAGDAKADGTTSGDGGASDASSGDAGGGDAGEDATQADGGCSTGAIAVVGGGGSANAFASIATGSGAFTTSSLTGGSGTIGSPVSVTAFGNGFAAVARVDTLRATIFDGNTWSGLTAVGAIGTSDMPALAALGTKLHVVYSGPTGDAAVDHKYFHGTYVTSWDAATDPVVSAGAQDFAPRGPSAATIDGKVVIAEAGDDTNVYAHAWSGGWETVVNATATAPAPKAAKDVTPRIVALQGSAAGDAMIVFVRSGDFKISSMIRTALGAWLTPVVVDTNAFTTEGVSAAALPGGKVIVVWRGTDTKPYYVLFNGTTWSPPTPFFTSAQPSLNGIPQVARGICGDDAVVAYAEASASAKVTRLRGSSWSTPEALTGSSGAGEVGIATR